VRTVRDISIGQTP